MVRAPESPDFLGRMRQINILAESDADNVTRGTDLGICEGPRSEGSTLGSVSYESPAGRFLGCSFVFSLSLLRFSGDYSGGSFTRESALSPGSGTP